MRENKERKISGAVCEQTSWVVRWKKIGEEECSERWFPGIQKRSRSSRESHIMTYILSFPPFYRLIPYFPARDTPLSATVAHYNCTPVPIQSRFYVWTPRRQLVYECARTLEMGNTFQICVGVVRECVTKWYLVSCDSIPPYSVSNSHSKSKPMCSYKHAYVLYKTTKRCLASRCQIRMSTTSNFQSNKYALCLMIYAKQRIKRVAYCLIPYFTI